MPYKKTKNYRKKAPRRRKYGNRKANKAKYGKASNLVTIRGPTGLADRVRVKLTYAEVIHLTGAASSLYQFRGNSLFDPDLTGAGHQPYMFDQWSLMYSRYRVFGSSIKVNALNESGTVAAQVIVYPSGSVSAVANTISEASELPRAGETYIIPVASRFPVMIKRYASTRSIEGLKKTAVSIDDTYAAPVTTNPGNVWEWNIVTESIDLTTTLDAYLSVKMVYYAEFYEPKVVAQS